MPNLQDNPQLVRILGMPVYTTGALPALGTAGDILLIDPSYYLIGDRQSISIAYSEHYAFTSDQGTWRMTQRVDGQPWLDNYITLENASTTVSPFVGIT
jgi:HK97 family phage major capsid protein